MLGKMARLNRYEQAAVITGLFIHEIAAGVPAETVEKKSRDWVKYLGEAAWIVPAVEILDVVDADNTVEKLMPATVASLALQYESVAERGTLAAQWNLQSASTAQEWQELLQLLWSDEGQDAYRRNVEDSHQDWLAAENLKAMIQTLESGETDIFEQRRQAFRSSLAKAAADPAKDEKQQSRFAQFISDSANTDVPENADEDKSPESLIIRFIRAREERSSPSEPTDRDIPERETTAEAVTPMAMNDWEPKVRKHIADSETSEAGNEQVSPFHPDVAGAAPSDDQDNEHSLESRLVKFFPGAGERTAEEELVEQDEKEHGASAEEAVPAVDSGWESRSKQTVAAHDVSEEAQSNAPHPAAVEESDAGEITQHLEELRARLIEMERLASEGQAILAELAPQIDRYFEMLQDMERVMQRWSQRAA
jgi:hypothetical protein